MNPVQDVTVERFANEYYITALVISINQEGVEEHQRELLSPALSQVQADLKQPLAAALADEGEDKFEIIAAVLGH
jgi:hypothetical protein